MRKLFNKFWRWIRPVRRSAAERAKEEAREWVERKARDGVGRSTRIVGGQRDGDGEPYETHEMPDEFGEISSEDLAAIKDNGDNTGRD